MFSGTDQVADTVCKITKVNAAQKNGGISEVSTLIIIEDVQWMDGLSLEVLNNLVDQIEKLQNLALLLTFRDEESGANTKKKSGTDNDPDTDEEEDLGGVGSYSESERQHLITALKARAKRLKFNSLWIDLQCLPKQDAFVFCTKLLNGEPNELTFAKLYETTKGDPFFLELLINWLMEKNLIRTEKSGTITVALDVSQFPSSVAQLVQARYNLLPDDHKWILQLAASGGEYFDPIYISSASKAVAGADTKPNESLSVEKVIEGLHAADRIGLVTTINDFSVLLDEATRKWKFKHDLMYRAIFAMIPVTRLSLFEKVTLTDKKKLNLRLKSSYI